MTRTASSHPLFDGRVDFDTVADRIRNHPVEGPPAELRKAYATLMLGEGADGHPVPASATAERLGQVPVLRFDGSADGAPTDAAIVYFHGGGDVFGSPATHVRLLTALSRITGLRVYAVDYRLAPEHQWPAQLEDATTVVSELRTRGIDRIGLAGDSSGGHLALVTALHQAAAGTPVQAVAAFSPNTDRSGKSDTREANTPRDVMNSDQTDLRMARLTFGTDFDANDPDVSPLLADLSLLPPTHLEVGNVEVLLGDSLLLHEYGKRAGADISLHRTDDAFHMWQLWTPWLPEAEQSITRAGDSLTRHLS